MPASSLRVVVALNVLAASATSFAQARVANMDQIRANDLRAHLEFIAHDLLEGRDTPSRGLDLANLYVASQLKLWGVQPAGDPGSFWQAVPLVSRLIDPKASFVEFGGERFTFGDFVTSPTALDWSGQLVYVGHGVQAPAAGVDPYAGITLTGKILVVRGTVSTDITRTQGAKTADRVALDGGALGVVRISGVNEAEWEQTVTASLSPGRARPAWQGARAGGRVSVTLSAELGAKVLASVKGFDEAKPKAVEIPGEFKLKVEAGDRPLPSHNVVAVVPGSDPVLSKEYVAVSAHIDHIGMRPTPPGVDGIFNGAHDDGSGVVALLELAHAFSTGQRPKRSILFVWHCGEEKGLWGSDYFVNNPTVPLKDVTALINIDMIGRSKIPGDTNPRNNVLMGPNGVYVVGSRRISNELGDLLASVNSRTHKLAYDYKYDDPNDRENIYGRSDHYNYALKGIPIAFFFDGVHEHYHQVGDHVDTLDFGKMERVTQTIYATLWELANRKERVRKN